ncbi:MAG: glycosyltransferase family 2 protein [Deltaproteobacteria bacterium]|nr:glycosyltransferase family 2 protein [Deltaproteobacteria bacterium]
MRAHVRGRPFPAVSVIVPVHNRAALLRACLRSLSLQDFRDFEIVVADDASTDDSARRGGDGRGGGASRAKRRSVGGAQ